MRHIDLLHTDWLQTERTRSHSSEHVYLNGTVHTGVRSAWTLPSDFASPVCFISFKISSVNVLRTSLYLFWLCLALVSTWRLRVQVHSERMKNAHFSAMGVREKRGRTGISRKWRKESGKRRRAKKKMGSRNEEKVKCNVNVEFKVTLHEQVHYRGTLRY